MSENPFCTCEIGSQYEECDTDCQCCDDVDRCEPDDQLVKALGCKRAEYAKDNQEPNREEH